MALSGTLDTFALPDVLRLIASTAKTGRLRVSGDRGSGSLWVVDGEAVSSELTSINSLNPTIHEVVFGLLRFDAGSFTFESDAVAPNAGPGMAMEPVLAAAEQMLAEWRSIEKVVPSLDVWVALRPELDGPDVMVDAMRWRLIATVGSGVQVGVVAESLELNEVDACRLVKEMIELGLVEKIDAPVAAAVSPVAELASEPIAEPITEPIIDDSFGDDAPETGDDEPASTIDEPSLTPSAADDDPGAPIDDTPSTVPSLAALAPSGEASADANGHAAPDDGAGLFSDAAPADASAEDLNPAEMARQLANLSPKAAKAVAAAAKASTEAERDAALAAVEAEDGTVNRGLLLKFLGSVDS